MVKIGDVINTERLGAEVGSSIEMSDIKAVSDGSNTFFTPVQCQEAGSLVRATVLEHKKTSKIIVFKKKRRHNYRRKQGHRQSISVIRITDISIEKV